MTAIHKEFGLTRAESSALEHRLTQSDCLCDVFSPENVEDGWPCYAREDVAAVVDLLLQGDLRTAEAINDMMPRHILADCVEGSTWVACAITAHENGERGVPSPGQAYNTLRSLAKKLEPYCGRRLRVPGC